MFPSQALGINAGTCLHFLNSYLDRNDPCRSACDSFFGVSVFDMGLALFAFFFNLVLTGWAMSQFVTAILIRYGLGAESLTWVLPFLIAPFSCIYYPLSTLPGWMQEIAAFIPTTYVFEGMRALLIEGVWRQDLLLKALSFNLIYLESWNECILICLSSCPKTRFTSSSRRIKNEVHSRLPILMNLTLSTV